jgi:hypothetical protein
VREFDELVWRLDVLCMNGSITSRDRFSLLTRWKRLIFALPRELQALWEHEKSTERRTSAIRARKNSTRASTATIQVK